MLETEFVRSLHCNYERVLLKERPDDQRYQYCILTRGGIKSLLPSSLRYINGQAYLYYDITSRQNVAQLCSKQMIGREWVTRFFASYREVCRELGRFLLDERNIMVFPEQIFEDLTSHRFFFLYLPYYEGESGMMQLLEFLLEHIDYEDEKLVECIYSMYEQLERIGAAYLQEKIFEDARLLDGKEAGQESDKIPLAETADDGADGEDAADEEVPFWVGKEKTPSKNGLWNLLGRKKRDAAAGAVRYREEFEDRMEDYAVAEEEEVFEEYGQTVYEEQIVDTDPVHKLYTPDGRVAATIESDIRVGKQKEDVEFLLEDESVSRIHARIYREGDEYFLEDLNSTNGTFKNGLRLQPYEKRRIKEGDEIRFGKLLFVYR